MQHHFDVELAKQYGIVEAVLLNHFEYWIELNRANGKNYFEGRYWTFNSMKAFSEIFPYLSEKKIRNALKNLQDAGLILTGNFNKSAYDRTLWYAFSDLAESILPKRQMEVAEKANQNSQKGEPIPDNNPVDEPDNSIIFDSAKGQQSKPKRKRKSDSAEDVEAAIKAFGYPESTNERLREWLEVRSAKRTPNTVSAIQKCIKTLPDMARKSNLGIDAYLDQVIMRGWAAFYEIKAYQPNNGAYSRNPEPPAPQYREAK